LVLIVERIVAIHYIATLKRGSIKSQRRYGKVRAKWCATNKSCLQKRTRDSHEDLFLEPCYKASYGPSICM